MFYSQFGEDSFLNDLFAGIKNGICIEIGAYDGRECSNTLYFEERGWDCLCIEANPTQYNKCKLIRKNTIHCAVSNKNKDNMPFYVYQMNDGNEAPISSLEPDSRLIKSHMHIMSKEPTKVDVSCRTLTSILDDLNYAKIIDFVSVDTENTELDVLKGIDFSKYFIKVFIVENNYDEPFCEDYLKTFGYKKIHRTGVNDIYMQESFLINTTSSPSFVSLSQYAETSNNDIQDSVNIALNTAQQEHIEIQVDSSINKYYKNFHGEVQQGKHIDETLREYFPDYSYKGIILDIGAYEPINISNSYHFEKNEWEVFCFEANTTLIDVLKKYRKNVYNYAISNENKLSIEFNIVHGGWGGGSKTAGLSAINLDPQYMSQFHSGIRSIQKINIPQMSLNSILPVLITKKVIDIVSIDVEGGELDVLKGINLNDYIVKVFVIENVYHSPNIGNYLTQYGYYLDKTIDYNDYYLHNSFKQ
jgi:FkbM family methyltransferase